MSNLMERLDSLRALIQEPEFLEGKGLSNEVNIRIFCYDPKEEMAVRHFTEKLMTDQSLNCHLIEYNLYRVFLSICDDKRITDRVAQQEEKKGKQFVLDQMKRMANNTAFINKMQYEPHEPGDVILITGVGEATRRCDPDHRRRRGIPVHQGPCTVGCNAAVFLGCPCACNVSGHLRWPLCETI